MAFSKDPSDRRATKHVLASRTNLCAIIGMLISAAGLLFGYEMSCEDQTKLVNLLLPLFTLLTSFGTFIFRILATKMIG